MKLSTSTNIMDRLNKKQNSVTPEECIVACAKAGYKVLDMNFCDMSNEGMPLTFDNWEEWVHSIKKLADSLGITFSQSHSAFYNVCDMSIKDRPWRDELARRAIIGSAILEVKWVVFHAGTVYDNGYSAKKSKQSNIEYFTPLVNLAKEVGVGIALENIMDKPVARGRDYAGTVEDLIDLVDSFDDSAVGICWDFGHGNLMKVDQVKALKQIGSRLVATHVADNYGVIDDHIAPYTGSIDWEKMMKALKEIDYKYDFTYEIHNFTDRVPLALRDASLKYSYEIGMYLISLAQ